MLTFAALIEDETLREKYERLYNQYKTPLFRSATAILHDRFLAEDAVSETFFRVAKDFANLAQLSDKRFERCINIILRNVSIDQCRYRDRHDVPMEELKDQVDLNGIDDQVFGKIGYEMILKQIGNMKDIYREVLELYYVNHCSAREIGDLLGIRETTVYSNLSRAKKTLAEKLEGICSE